MRTNAAEPLSTEAAEILRARARELAMPPEQPAEGEHSLDVLEFSLAQECYAVETQYVREVHPLSGLTPVPCTPSFVSGVITIRGEIMAVLDIRKYLHIPERGLTDLHSIIIVEDARLSFGLLVDAVAGVRSIPVARLQASLTGVRSEYLKGVTAEHLVILDMARILADPGVIVHEDV